MPRLLDSDLPLVAAPMAGGGTTVDLVAATSAAGAFAFLAAGYLDAAALEQQVEAARPRARSFGVNLFVPGPPAIDGPTYAAYRDRLAAEAAALGVELPAAPHHDDDAWRDKLDLLLDRPVPVVSLTFGLPSAADLRALQAAGTSVLASVTRPEEARLAADAGVDGLVVQGVAAGGHSATFTPDRPPVPRPTADLVRAVAAVAGLPIVAAGGVASPADVRELLAAGATEVAVGTLFLRTDESGAHATHRDALIDPRFSGTVVTRAFTGRPARALRNGFVDRHEAVAPLGYPEVHHLTRALRRAAAAAGDHDRLHLWAGTGHAAAASGPAAAVVAHLASGL